MENNRDSIYQIGLFLSTAFFMRMLVASKHRNGSDLQQIALQKPLDPAAKDFDDEKPSNDVSANEISTGNELVGVTPAGNISADVTPNGDISANAAPSCDVSGDVIPMDNVSTDATSIGDVSADVTSTGSDVGVTPKSNVSADATTTDVVADETSVDDVTHVGDVSVDMTSTVVSLCDDELHDKVQNILSLCHNEWKIIDEIFKFVCDEDRLDYHSILNVLERLESVHQLPLIKQVDAMSEVLSNLRSFRFKLESGKESFIMMDERRKRLEQEECELRLQIEIAMKSEKFDVVESLEYEYEKRYVVSSESYEEYYVAREGILKWVSKTGLISGKKTLKKVHLVNETNQDLIFIVSTDPRARQEDAGKFNLSKDGVGGEVNLSSKRELHDIIPIGAGDGRDVDCITKHVFISVCQLQGSKYIVYRYNKDLKVGFKYTVTPNRLVKAGEEGSDFLKRFY